MYVSRFVSFRDFGFGTLDKIMSEMLWDFRDHLADTGIATSTINRNMFALTSVFSHAVETCIIYNELAFRKYHKEESVRPIQFNDDEYRRLIAYSRETVYDWITDLLIVGCNTGMLESSIVFLRSPTLNKLHVQQRKDA